MICLFKMVIFHINPHKSDFPMDFPMDGPTWPVWGWWTRASKINGAMVAAKNAG